MLSRQRDEGKGRLPVSHKQWDKAAGEATLFIQVAPATILAWLDPYSSGVFEKPSTAQPHQMCM